MSHNVPLAVLSLLQSFRSFIQKMFWTQFCVLELLLISSSVNIDTFSCWSACRPDQEIKPCDMTWAEPELFFFFFSICLSSRSAAKEKGSWVTDWRTFGQTAASLLQTTLPLLGAAVLLRYFTGNFVLTVRYPESIRYRYLLSYLRSKHVFFTLPECQFQSYLIFQIMWDVTIFMSLRNDCNPDKKNLFSNSDLPYFIFISVYFMFVWACHVTEGALVK